MGFTDLSHRYDDASSPSTVLKRRALALLVFVGCAFGAPASAKPGPDGDMSVLVSTLVVLAEQKATQEDVSQAAQTALTNCLRVMSATNFINVTADMLKSNNEKVGSATP
jgi:hypothetical protein